MRPHALLLAALPLFAPALPAQVVDWSTQAAASGTPASSWSDEFDATLAPSWLRDADGNLYATGLEHTGDNDALLLVKYAASGERLWKRRIDTPGQDGGRGLPLDRAGNLLLLGMLGDGFDQVPTVFSFDPDGNERWRVPLTHAAGQVDPEAVAGGAAGRVYVLLRVNDAQGSPDGLLLAWQDEGDGVSELWSRPQHVFASDSSDYPAALTVSPDGTRVLAAVNNNLHNRVSVYEANGDLLWSASDDAIIADYVEAAFLADDGGAVTIGSRQFTSPVFAFGVARVAYDANGQVVDTDAHQPAIESAQLAPRSVARSADGSLFVLADYSLVAGPDFLSGLELLQFLPDGSAGWQVTVEPASAATGVADGHLALHDDGATPALYAAWRLTPASFGDPDSLRVQRFDTAGTPTWAQPAELATNGSRLDGLSADGAGPALAYSADLDARDARRARARALAAADGSLRFDQDPGESSPLAARVLALAAPADGGVVQLVDEYAGTRRLGLERRDVAGNLIFAVQPPAAAPSFDHALGMDGSDGSLLARIERLGDVPRVRLSAFGSDGTLAWEYLGEAESGLLGLASTLDASGSVLASVADVPGDGLVIRIASVGADGSERWVRSLDPQPDTLDEGIDVVLLPDGDALLAWGSVTFGPKQSTVAQHWMRLDAADGQTVWSQSFAYDQDDGSLVAAAVADADRAYLLTEYSSADGSLNGQRVLAIDLATGAQAWAAADGLGVEWSYPVRLIADAAGVAVLAEGAEPGAPDRSNAYLARYRASDGQRDWLAVADAGAEDWVGDLARDADGRWYVGTSQRNADSSFTPYLTGVELDGSQRWQVPLPSERGRIGLLQIDAAGQSLYSGGRLGIDGQPSGRILARILLDLPDAVFGDGFETD